MIPDPITVKLMLRDRDSSMEFEGPIKEAIVSAMAFAIDHPWFPIEVTVIEEGEHAKSPE